MTKAAELSLPTLSCNPTFPGICAIHNPLSNQLILANRIMIPPLTTSTTSLCWTMGFTSGPKGKRNVSVWLFLSFFKCENLWVVYWVLLKQQQFASLDCLYCCVNAKQVRNLKYTSNKMLTRLRLTPPVLCGSQCGGSCPQRMSAHETAPTPAGPAWGSWLRNQTGYGSGPHAYGSEWSSSLIHPHPAPP